MASGDRGLQEEIGAAGCSGAGVGLADRGRIRRDWRAVILPTAILSVCAGLAYVLLGTGPVAERAPRAREARLVDVVRVSRTDEKTRVAAMGTVLPARQVVIQPQVIGRIVEVSPEFVPGGRFAPGDLMVRIDPSDYQLAVRQRQSELAQARADLQIEVGNQSVAQLEYELLGETVEDTDRALVLRQPQLDTVRARVAAAEAALEKARLDLERTWIRAPFPALVRARGAELGARVDSSTPLVTLVDTRAYWVQALVPVTQLGWIDVRRADGTAGSKVEIVAPGAGPEAPAREGEVVRLLGDLESEGRMARVLVRVEDPLALDPSHADAPVLLLDSFVNVRIEGRPLEGVVSVDRSLLRDGDRTWVMGEDGTLEIRDLTVAFRGDSRVLVSEGLAEGDRIVVSELSSPVAGMALRTGEPFSRGTAESVQAKAEVQRDVSDSD